MLYGKHHGEACYRASLLDGKEIFLAVIKLRARLCKRGDAIAPSLLSSGSKLQRQQLTSLVPAEIACRIELVAKWPSP
jgi:hypothetical protein